MSINFTLATFQAHPESHKEREYFSKMEFINMPVEIWTLESIIPEYIVLRNEEAAVESSGQSYSQGEW